MSTQVFEMAEFWPIENQREFGLGLAGKSLMINRPVDWRGCPANLVVGLGDSSIHPIGAFSMAHKKRGEEGVLSTSRQQLSPIGQVARGCVCNCCPSDMQSRRSNELLSVAGAAWLH